MSGRFVRASKYRHVHGEIAKKEKCYLNVNPACFGDGDFIRANRRFIAYGGMGGGGPLVVIRREEYGKLGHSPPTLNVHKAKLLDFEFSPFMETMVATAGEDNLVKISIIPEGGLTETQETAVASLEGHQKKISWVHFSPTVNYLLASAAYDHTVKLWDIQKQMCVTSYDDHHEVVYSFMWKGDSSQIATTCKDKKVRLFDPRSPQTAQIADGPQGSKPSRIVYLDGHDKIAAVGFSATSSRQYIIYDARNLRNPLVAADIDQSAGVLIPYFDADNSILYLGGKGDGNIRYFEVVNEEPYLFFLSEFRSSESQKGVTFLPKQACDVTTCEIAVALRLMRDQIQPVSFQVPRKSDLFQGDIFPDTAAGVPSMTIAEWQSGLNTPPIKVSMNPSQRTGDVGGPRAEFKAQRSPAELERELEAAQEKIRKLELELEALRKH